MLIVNIKKKKTKKVVKIVEFQKMKNIFRKISEKLQKNSRETLAKNRKKIWKTLHLKKKTERNFVRILEKLLRNQLSSKTMKMLNKI